MNRLAGFLDRWGLMALAALSVLVAVASLRWPFGFDQGVFAWAGDVIGRGGLPYRDAWDVKGPVPYYVYALVDAATGHGMWGIRVFDLVLLAGAAAIGGRIVAHLAGRRAGIYAGLALALVYLGGGYWNTAQPDAWAGLLMVYAAAPLLPTERPFRPGRLALTGMLIGLCTLIKPVYGLFGLIPLVGVFASPLPARRRIAVLTALAAGFLAPLGAAVAWFAAHGALGQFYDVYVRYNLEQSGHEYQAPGGLFRATLRNLTSRPAVVIALLAAAAATPRLWKSAARSLLVLWAWVIAPFVIVVIQRKLWPYHWQALWPALAVLGGVAISRLWQDARSTAGRLVLLSGTTIMMVWICLPPARESRKWLQLAVGRISTDTYEGHFGWPGAPGWLPADRRLAAFLVSHTSPGDRVLVWSDLVVNYLCARPSTGRVVFHIPINTPLNPQRRLRYRRELLDALAANPPAYIAVPASALAAADSVSRANLGARFPELATFIASRFHPVWHVGRRWEIYAPDAPARAPAPGAAP